MEDFQVRIILEEMGLPTTNLLAQGGLHHQKPKG